MSQHNTHELVKKAETRDDSHVHATWLHGLNGDQNRWRMMATHLAMGERLDVTHSTTPLMVARLVFAIEFLHVDKDEVHDWIVGFGDVTVALYHDKKAKLVHVHPRHVPTLARLEA